MKSPNDLANVSGVRARYLRRGRVCRQCRLGILRGFAPQVVKHINTHAPAYSSIVHMHAVVFVGWLALLTTEVLLIRTSRPDVHRTLGVAGVILAAAMIVIGPVTAVIVDRLRLALPHPDPGFIVIQTLDILAFAGLVIPAFVWRKKPAVHKRLTLLATIYIADARVNRKAAAVHGRYRMSMEARVGIEPA